MNYRILFLFSVLSLNSVTAWGMKKEHSVASLLKFDVHCNDCLTKELEAVRQHKSKWKAFFLGGLDDHTPGPSGYTTKDFTHTPLQLYKNFSSTKFALAIGKRCTPDYLYRRITRDEYTSFLRIFRDAPGETRMRTIKKIVDSASVRTELNLREDLSRVIHILKNDTKKSPLALWP